VKFDVWISIYEEAATAFPCDNDTSLVVGILYGKDETRSYSCR